MVNVQRVVDLLLKVVWNDSVGKCLFIFKEVIIWGLYREIVLI